MNIPLMDKSSYLRGLLILAKKDNHITPLKKTIIYNAGVSLGFSSEFCTEILKTLFKNKCLCDEPIKFINYKVAKSFISDGLTLASAGKSISPSQLRWLVKSAQINGINVAWLKEELLNCDKKARQLDATQLTLYSII
jgi:hypothetical protein